MFDKFNFSEIVGAVTSKSRTAQDHFTVRSDVEVTIRDKEGNIKHHSFQHNLRTNVGADFWNAQLFGSASATAVAKWIALTENASAPSAGDTTLASEETTNGLQRAIASVSHSASATSSVLSKTFTYTGSSAKVIAKVGLFDASSSGTLVLETLLSSTGTVNTSGDTIAILWTVNF